MKQLAVVRFSADGTGGRTLASRGGAVQGETLQAWLDQGFDIEAIADAGTSLTVVFERKLK